MSKYWAFYRLRFEKTLFYRGAVIVLRLQNIIMLLTLTAVWLASKSTGEIGGYTKNQLVNYYLVGSLVNSIVFWHAGGLMREEIRNGEIAAKILAKPVSYYWSKFFEEFAWHTIAPLFALISTGVVAILLGANLTLNLSPQMLLAMIVAVSFSSVIFLNLSSAVAMLTFWFTETENIFNLLWAGIFLLGGQAIPISFFMGRVGEVVRLLPFRYIYSFPLEIYSGKVVGWQILYGYLAQVFWIEILGLLYIFLWRRGVARYSAYGG